MITCPGCNQDLPDADLSAAFRCPQCGWEAEFRGGYCHLAPELAAGNEDYDASFFSRLKAVEDGHFWFEARNRLIRTVATRTVGSEGRLLEIGCGTGFVLRELGRALPNWELCGSEIFSEGLHVAAERVPRATFLQLDARALPFREHFNCIGAFDVLEHIDEDELVMSQIHGALAPGGTLLVTVPQHKFLWSSYDDQSCHKRRYVRSDMLGKLTKAGFEVSRVTSFVSLLLPLMLASRLRKRDATNDDAMAEFAIGKTTNQALKAVMSVERWMILSLGLSLPMGGSLLVAARKRS